MAIRMNASGEGVQYATQHQDWDDNGVTIMCWARIVTDRAADTGIVAIRGAGLLYVDSSRRVSLYTGEGIGYQIGTVVPVGEWHHFALTRSGIDPATWTCYYDGVVDVSDSTTDPTGDPRPYFGNNQYGDWLNGRVAAGKIYLATLTDNEIRQERYSYTPVRNANLWSWVPMLTHTQLTDFSGFGNTPSAMGTLSTEDGPPINWGHRSGRIFLPLTVPVSTLERSASISATALIVSSAQFFTTFSHTIASSATTSISTLGQFFSIAQTSASLDAVASITSSALFFTTLDRVLEVTDVVEININTQFFSTLLGINEINATASISTTGTILIVNEHETSISVNAVTDVVLGRVVEFQRQSSNVVAGQIQLTGIKIVERTVVCNALLDVLVIGISFSTFQSTSQVVGTAGIQTNRIATYQRSITTQAVPAILIIGHSFTIFNNSSTASASSLITVSGIIPTFLVHDRQCSFVTSVAINTIGGPWRPDAERTCYPRLLERENIVVEQSRTYDVEATD